MIRSHKYDNPQFRERLPGDSTEGLKVYEQLAIYYEHHARIPERAARLSREALVKLQAAHRAGHVQSSQYMRWHAAFRHRMARLSRKIPGAGRQEP